MAEENAKKTLTALAELNKPASLKEISELAGLDSKVVSAEIKTLKKDGLVDSPARCKYGITDTGKAKL